MRWVLGSAGCPVHVDALYHLTLAVAVFIFLGKLNCENKTLTRAAGFVNTFAEHFGSVQSPDLPNCKTCITTV